MYFIIKVNDRYLAQPRTDNWEAEINSWTIDLQEARIGSFGEMNKLARKITRPGSILVTKVEIVEP